MPSTIVIFGASGDLTGRKLVPALYRLHRKGRLPEGTRVLGFSRTAMDDEAWRARLSTAAKEQLGGDFSQEVWREFAKNVHYHAGDIERAEDFAALKSHVEKLEAGQMATRVFYLATGPEFFEKATGGLGGAGLNGVGQAGGETAAPRIVIEKPFGSDLASAQRLNAVVHEFFHERQVFRIDHYLGKETVQNILVLRFANAIFEPIWNRRYIDHVQITAAEEGDVGRRGAYYDAAGVLRDMFQNHLMQLLCVTAMEPPSRFEAGAVRNEKVKVLDTIRPFTPEEAARFTFRAQYEGYRKHERVANDSQTATFAAVRLGVDNWRWQGVPFYLRSGKAMDCRSTQIMIQFRQPPHLLFASRQESAIQPNRLVIQIQPAEGIYLQLQSKVPDAGMKVRTTELDFRFCERRLPEAYERLLLDVLSGDASLFARADEVELSWRIIDPIARAWEEQGVPPLHIYERGTWGPAECGAWMAQDGREWLDVCPVLH
ncbi:MAG: glucose-6-phosphate dehydrogenase [Planctomycetia bacterium]|nr:glucose-6-phosphate dehydrogenase [Planctomycetia bacterium]